VSPLGYDIPRFNNLESPIKPPLHLPLGARRRAGADENRGIHPGHRFLGSSGDGDRLRVGALAA
jgi:hypothetical protein